MRLSAPTLQKYSRIVLVGFMGAGKSTAGLLLSSRLGWSFYDADDALEKRTGQSIEELFSVHGESGFRALEEDTVAQLLKEETAVIALGGGAIESPATRCLLVQATATCTIFLEAPLKTMIDRCELSPTIRPLLKDQAGLAARYQRRLPHYRNATFTVSTEGLTPAAIVEIMLQRLMATPDAPGIAGKLRERPL